MKDNNELTKAVHKFLLSKGFELSNDRFPAYHKTNRKIDIRDSTCGFYIIEKMKMNSPVYECTHTEVLEERNYLLNYFITN